MDDMDPSDALLQALNGQWIELIHVSVDGLVERVVTSKGRILTGRMSAEVHPAVQRDDSRVLGCFVQRCEDVGGGTWNLTLTDADGRERLEMHLRAPWQIQGPRGLHLACSVDGTSTATPPGDRIIATTEAIAEWRQSEPSDLERELLHRAALDWVTPADIQSILMESGITDPHEICELGVELFARLVMRGDLVVGAITERRFEPSLAEPADDIEVAAHMWRALAPQLLSPGQICWLNTPDEVRRFTCEC